MYGEGLEVTVREWRESMESRDVFEEGKKVYE